MAGQLFSTKKQRLGIQGHKGRSSQSERPGSVGDAAASQNI